MWTLCPMCCASGNILWKTTSFGRVKSIDKVCVVKDFASPLMFQNLRVETIGNYFIAHRILIFRFWSFCFYWNLLSDKTVTFLYNSVHETSLAPCVIWSNGSILLGCMVWVGVVGCFFFFLSSCVVFAAGTFLNFY